jgi:hypothetical protein
LCDIVNQDLKTDRMSFQVESPTLQVSRAETGCPQVQLVLFSTTLATAAAKTYLESQNAAREQKPRAGEPPVAEQLRGQTREYLLNFIKTI